MSKIKIIFGLGNIGEKYKNTRHNAGEWFINKIAKNKKQNFIYKSKLHCNIAKININYNNILLGFPTTYMNNSGISIIKVINFYQIKLEEILIAHDDLDLNSGQINIIKGGYHGGHNGLKSINKYLGSNNYLRLRIGIDYPKDKLKISKYVLSIPYDEQKKNINYAIYNCMPILNDIIDYKLEYVKKQLHLNNLNKRKYNNDI